MSITHIYYLGIRNKKTNMVTFAGPYDKEGKILPVFQQGSHSPLADTFSELPEEEMSDEVRKEFTYENYCGKDILDTVHIGKFEYEIGIPILTRYNFAA